MNLSHILDIKIKYIYMIIPWVFIRKATETKPQVKASISSNKKRCAARSTILVSFVRKLPHSGWMLN